MVGAEEIELRRRKEYIGYRPKFTLCYRHTVFYVTTLLSASKLVDLMCAKIDEALQVLCFYCSASRTSTAALRGRS